MIRCILGGGVWLLLASASFGQTIEKRVGAATRIDWEFAARGFGKDVSLPAGFDSTKQKYQLFLPKGHAKDKPAGLILFISAGDAPAGLTAWQKTCQDQNFVFASPFAAGNNVPAAQRTRVILDVLDDVRRTCKIDPDRTYLTGFSGGGRMACAIGFALPEYFGGVVPLCGTNPPPGLTASRHLLCDRLSVAFVTGEKDFNRKENEVYMAPWFADIGVRSKLFLMPKAGHAIPSPAIVADIHAWLEDDLPRRRTFRKARPQLVAGVDDTPTAADQPRRWLEAAKQDLGSPDRTWRAVSLLQAIPERWPKSDAAAAARAALKQVAGNDPLLALVDAQAPADEIPALTAQATALERFGNIPAAIRAWSLLADRYEGTDAAKSAAERIRRLQSK